MLQWKARLYVMLVLAALVIAAFGAFANVGDQFGW
jgi:hypothetical protein